MSADAAELVDSAGRADDRPIANCDMAADGRGVSQDGVTPDMRIVREVDVSHQQVVVADGGEHSAALRAAMDGDKFANLIAIADACLRRLAVILQNLRGNA